MSAYREFNGKSVEEALKAARDEFGVELSDLDFEILTPGSRGVLGMGAEPARIVAAPRSALGGAAPKREAAAAAPLPPAPPREERAATVALSEAGIAATATAVRAATIAAPGRRATTTGPSRPAPRPEPRPAPRQAPSPTRGRPKAATKATTRAARRAGTIAARAAMSERPRR